MEDIQDGCTDGNQNVKVDAALATIFKDLKLKRGAEGDNSEIVLKKKLKLSSRACVTILLWRPLTLERGLWQQRSDFDRSGMSNWKDKEASQKEEEAESSEHIT